MGKEEARQAVSVPEGRNRIAVGAQGHSSVSLLRDGVPLESEHSGGNVAAFVVEPGDYEVTSDGTIESVDVDALELGDTLRWPEPLLLELSSDAPDRHVVDGVGEVPADGRSYCTVAVQRAGETGGDAEVYLRTTGGRLEDEAGNRIRSVRLQRGRASFRLVAGESPRLVTVTAFGEATPAPARLEIEFV
jgi:hypothetical protein